MAEKKKSSKKKKEKKEDKEKKEKTTSKTVMIVDDEEDIRDTIKSILESEDYEVITAKDGDDALKKLKKGKNPDLVLLDIMMPGTSAKEVVKRIKNSKVIFVSVVKISESEKKDLFKQDNVIGYIQKPFDTDDLIKKVRDAVR